MKTSDFILYCIIIAGAVTFYGTQRECEDLAFSMWEANRDVIDTMRVEMFH